MTMHRKAKLKPAPESVHRFKVKLRTHFRRGRGQSLSRVIKELSPVLRGCINYFRWSEVKPIFVNLDQRLRRRLRVIIWHQAKRAQMLTLLHHW